MDSNESVPSTDLTDPITTSNSIETTTTCSLPEKLLTTNNLNYDGTDAADQLQIKRKLSKRKLCDSNTNNYSTIKLRTSTNIIYKGKFNDQDDQIDSDHIDGDIASDNIQTVNKVNDVNVDVCPASNSNGIEDNTKCNSHGNISTDDVDIIENKSKSNSSMDTTENENAITTDSYNLATINSTNPFISMNDSNYFTECYPQDSLLIDNSPFKSNIFNDQLPHSVFSSFVVHTDVTTTTFSTFTKTTPTIQGTAFPTFVNKNESNPNTKIFSDNNNLNINDDLMFTHLSIRQNNYLPASNNVEHDNLADLEPSITLGDTWPRETTELEMSSLTTQELAHSISDLLVFNQSNLANLNADANSNTNNTDNHNESAAVNDANNNDEDFETDSNEDSSHNSNSDLDGNIYQLFDPFQSDHSNQGEEPLVIMTKTENSCNFVERKILLGKQTKIGRSIGRTRPSSDNSIFDCKVLSRNHALLWYKDGKFYLKDTCSSNGTFVNNQRLSSANEKSLPQVLYSGDCVQFGVEVVEKKNVHSCVIATLRLFHPDGTEARKEYGDSLTDSLKEQINNPNMPIQIMPSQLIDIYYHVKESMRRQCLLENQIKTMKEVVQTALNYAKNNLQSSINEDRLLSRIQTLQSQLDIYIIGRNQRNAPQSSVVEIMQKKNLQLINDKENLEIAAKETLEKTLGNKVVLECALEQARADLQNKTHECDMLRESINTDFKDMKILLETCDKLKRENEELLLKMKKSVEDAQQQTEMAQCSNTFDSFSQTDEFTINETIINTTKILLNVDKQPSMESGQNVLPDELLKKVSMENFQQIKNFYEKMETEMKNVLKFLNDKIDHLTQVEKTVHNFNKHDKCEQIIKYYQNLVKKNSANELELKNEIENYRNIIDEQRKNNADINEQLEQMKSEFNNLKQTDTVEQSVQAILDTDSKSNPIDKPEQIELNNQQNCSHCSTLKGLVKLLKQLDSIEGMKNQQNTDSEIQLDNENDETLFEYSEKESNCDHNGNVDKIYKLMQEKITMMIQERQTIKSINDALNQELETVKNKYSWLSYQNDVSFGFAIFPLVAIFVAIIWAFYKQISYILATAGW